MAYRKLNADERLALENNGCRCEDWDNIEVSTPFRPEHYRNTDFAGKVKLGTTEGIVMRDGNIPMRAHKPHRQLYFQFPYRRPFSHREHRMHCHDRRIHLWQRSGSFRVE